MMNRNGAEDIYRPEFHFTPPVNWMNDPNGLVYFDGEYHLFYQHHPYSNVWGPMHWGHAVSRDLLEWEHLPIALWPDDNGFIYSGCAVVDWKDSTGFFQGQPGLVCIFTHDDRYPDGRLRQRQSLAYSTDNGRTWVKYEGNPVLANESLTDFRDPKVFWHEESGKWVLAAAAGDRVHFYLSDDLKTWTFASEFGADQGMHGGVWECPDLFELSVEGSEERRWVLTLSDKGAESGIANTQYFVGRFDGVIFSNDNNAETVLWADFGSDFFAAQSWSDIPHAPGDGRRIWVGWLANPGYAKLTPTGDWRGMLSVPRALSLERVEGVGLRLKQSPVVELERLRVPDFRAEDVMLAVGTSFKAKSAAMELMCELALGDVDRFDIVIAHGESYRTVIHYDRASERLTLDRTQSGDNGFDPSGRYAAQYHAPLKPVHNRISLRLYLDRSSIEIFANGGTTTLSHVLFAEGRNESVTLSAESGSARIVSLQAYQLVKVNTI
jgi:fructan beta-fructosidase